MIQFVVITKGATRISEVAARFMLDGMPGRQMAIDADLHAGLIDQHEAHRRREHVHRQADFFAAMDGAGKFVRGDAVAGVIITLVNIGAGLFLGIVQYGMTPARAVEVFTKLTIGDGLVSQVPAFLTALAAGLIVTRSSEESDLGREQIGQLFGRASVLAVAAGFLALLAFTALPKLPLLSLAAALGTGAYLIRNRGEQHIDETDAEPEPAASAEVPAERMEDLLHVDPLELEIGYRLIGLADPTRGGDLLDRVRAIRHRAAQDLGLIVPQVRIRDEMGVGPARVPAQNPGDRGGPRDRLRRPAAGRASPRPGGPACPRGATASTPSRASRASGSMRMAARWPRPRAAASSRPRPSSPATSARSCSGTPTS